MKKNLTLLFILFIISVYIVSFHSKIKSKLIMNKENTEYNHTITYRDGVEAADYSFEGLKSFLDMKTGVPVQPFNYNTKTNGEYLDFVTGLSTISAYMATGDEKYIRVARSTANFLNSNLSERNLVPVYSYIKDRKVDGGKLLCGSGGQATVLEFTAYLANYDPTYMSLMHKLAIGLMENCINPSNNLCWFQVNCTTGKPIKSEEFGYESQLGSQSISCAQALLAAYEADKSKIEYKEKAISILLAVWNTRDRKTNLISETWDISNNKVGRKLYPYECFRYDDMCGSYIRGLSMAYLITKDIRIEQVAKQYIDSVIKYTFDTTINGGAFRYLTDTKGNSKANCIETMHGLFISTLLQANYVFYEGKNKVIVEKCTLSAEHTIGSNIGIKNGMCPHAVSNNGEYLYKHNDSQLGYSILQYPFGYSLLSQVTKNSKYRAISNEVYRMFLLRHKIRDNVPVPKGYLNIVETTEPYGIEKDYLSPQWMYQAMYVPAYLLYNSIQVSEGVRIYWYHQYPPSVFGLVNDMPFWNIENVNVIKNRIILNKVDGKGTIDLNDLGYDLKDVYIDGKRNTKALIGNKIETQEGIHKYEIIYEKLLND